MNKKSIVCFGEILLRLSASQQKIISQSTTLEMFVGGAEANVAVNLACLEQPSIMVSAVPKNSLGDYAIRELNKYGVDTSYINKGQGRLGQYFLESGASFRQAEIIYDREHSVFAESTTEDYNWTNIFSNAVGFHVSGVTLALGEDVIEATLNAIEEAKQRGLLISFDGNFRPALWQGRVERAKQILNKILCKVEIAFLTEEDISLITGEKFLGDSVIESRKKACSFAFQKFPNLKQICSTYKQIENNGELLFKGLIVQPEKSWVSKEYLISSVVDQIGAGDAFASGILRGILNQNDAQQNVEFATALAVTKYSLQGDFAVRTLDQVEAVISGNWSKVKR